MPFKKVSIKEEVEKRIESDNELKNNYIESKQEYELIKQIVEIRNQLGLSQDSIANQSGLTQQMVSRIETIGNSPTLKVFLKYVNSLGLEIKIEKRQESAIKSR